MEEEAFPPNSGGDLWQRTRLIEGPRKGSRTRSAEEALEVRGVLEDEGETAVRQFLDFFEASRIGSIEDSPVFINGIELERERVADESLKHLGKQLSGRVAYEVNSGHRYLVAYGDKAEEERAHVDFETTVPERQVFVLGDNRNRSLDSRHFGPIPSTEIVGYVDYIFWPSESWSRFGVVDDRMP